MDGIWASDRKRRTGVPKMLSYLENEQLLTGITTTWTWFILSCQKTLLIICLSVVYVCRHWPRGHHLKLFQNVRSWCQRVHPQRRVRCQLCVGDSDMFSASEYKCFVSLQVTETTDDTSWQVHIWRGKESVSTAFVYILCFVTLKSHFLQQVNESASVLR